MARRLIDEWLESVVTSKRTYRLNGREDFTYGGRCLCFFIGGTCAQFNQNKWESVILHVQIMSWLIEIINLVAGHQNK